MNARTKWLITTVVAGGAAAVAAVLLSYPPAFGHQMLAREIALAALTAAGELVAISFPHGSESELITLTEIAIVADLVLLPASNAVLVALAGLAVALTIQRRKPVKALFNLGQYALSIVIAAAFYDGFGGGEFSSARGLVALSFGAAAFTATNFVTISAILAAAQDRPFRDVLVEERGLSLAIGVGCSSIGVVAVSAYVSRPGLLPFVLAPVLALHIAFRGWVKQKQLTASVVAEKTKLDRILEHSSEGIVLADGGSSVLVWSPAMERMTGISEAEAVGRQLPFLLRGRGRHGQAVSVSAATSADGFELELLSPAGEVRWLRGLHGPALGADGALQFDVLVVTDATREREVERLKSDFISTVSHELRTPLTPIKGFVSLLLRRGDAMAAPERQDALQTIMDRTDHMARLVEDLLLSSTMSRDGERRIPELQRLQMDVAGLLEKVVRPFRRQHPARSFVVESAPGLAVLVDPMRAEQMLAHLVSNAVKFSDDGTLVAVNACLEAGKVRIDVVDEGRGIPADKREVIFERFKRLEDPMVMETGGAGLGLFIARQLADAMDGTIAVHSEPGRGSTFTLRLPQVASAASGMLAS